MGCCNKPMPHGIIPFFAGFTDYTPVIPKLYYGVDDVEQRTKDLCAQLHKLACYADALNEHIELNADDIETLQGLFDEYISHGFDLYYEQQIEQWITEHATDIISQAVKMVFFGLTQDGHFVAYIPDSWSEIQFGTIMEGEYYGHLVLYLDIDETIG